jgi:PilZ domain-containing protein
MESAVIRNVGERRHSRRRRGLSEHGIASARVRRGVIVSIVDVSAGGVLVETAHRLLPGMPLEIHLERGRHISTVRGRVLRCSVARVSASLVCYRGAIGFDQHLSWFAEDDGSGSSFTNTEPQ